MTASKRKLEAAEQPIRTLQMDVNATKTRQQSTSDSLNQQDNTNAELEVKYTDTETRLFEHKQELHKMFKRLDQLNNEKRAKLYEKYKQIKVNFSITNFKHIIFFYRRESTSTKNSARRCWLHRSKC